MVSEGSRMNKLAADRLLAAAAAVVVSSVLYATLPSCYGLAQTQAWDVQGVGSTCYYACSVWNGCDARRIYRGTGNRRELLIVCGHVSTATLDDNTPPNIVCIGGPFGPYPVTVEGCQPSDRTCETPGKEGEGCPQC